MSKRRCADLTDVTLTYKDINSILTDNVNRAFQGNMAMKETQLVGQLWNHEMQETSPNDQILNQFPSNKKNAYLNEIQIRF